MKSVVAAITKSAIAIFPKSTPCPGYRNPLSVAKNAAAMKIRKTVTKLGIRFFNESCTHCILHTHITDGVRHVGRPHKCLDKAKDAAIKAKLF